jgi:hypothetical protein
MPLGSLVTASMHEGSLSHPRPVPWLALAAAVAVALGLTLPAIECPGLYYDEVLFVDGWSGVRCAWCPAGTPVMILSYLGALKTWLYWPFVDSLSAALIRLPGIALATVSLICAVLLAARLYGRSAAVLTALLLAVDPTFLFYQRLDWGPVAINICLRTVSLLLLVQWREDGGDWRLPVAGLLLGLGLYDKLTFAWYLLGLLLALGVTHRDWPRPRLSVLAFSALAFCVGALPLLSYNLIFSLASFREQPLMVHGASWVATVLHRLALMENVLSGEALYWNVNQHDLSCTLPAPACFAIRVVRAATPALVAVGFLLAATWRGLGRHLPTRLLLALVGSTAFFLVTVARVGPHHVPILLPFTHVLLAGLAVSLAARGRAWRTAIACTVAVMVAGQLGTSLATAASFRTTCGRGLWSGAVYALADEVARTPARAVYVADWGIAAQLRALVPDADVHEVAFALEEAPDERQVDDVLAEVRDHAGLLVLHDPHATEFAVARRRAIAGLRAMGVAPHAVHRLADREGSPVFEIVDVARIGETSSLVTPRSHATVSSAR